MIKTKEILEEKKKGKGKGEDPRVIGWLDFDHTPSAMTMKGREREKRGRKGTFFEKKKKRKREEDPAPMHCPDWKRKGKGRERGITNRARKRKKKKGYLLHNISLTLVVLKGGGEKKQVCRILFKGGEKREKGRRGKMNYLRMGGVMESPGGRGRGGGEVPYCFDFLRRKGNGGEGEKGGNGRAKGKKGGRGML